MAIQPNILFKADCLELLRRLDPDSVDLAYLDPPPPDPTPTTESHRKRPPNDQIRRLISDACQEVHRALKPIGVVFFHTAPSYAFTIRLIMNQIFGEEHFRGEIVWQPRAAQRRHISEHQSILFYSKSDVFRDNRVLRPLAADELSRKYRESDDSGPFALVDLTAPIDRSNLQWGIRGKVNAIPG